MMTLHCGMQMHGGVHVQSGLPDSIGSAAEIILQCMTSSWGPCIEKVGTHVMRIMKIICLPVCMQSEGLINEAFHNFGVLCLQK